jgi:predicted dehydrogenase
MDIGCYPIQIARYLFERDPETVSAIIERDPDFQTDRLTSGLMDFGSGHCVFTCSTQLTPYQRVQILGTQGRIEIEIPFNAPPDKPTRIWVNDVVEEFPTCDQYTIQAEVFGEAVMGSGEVPTPLENSLGNMKVIEAMFRSAKDGVSVVVSVSRN